MAQLLLAAALGVHLGWVGLTAILHPAPGSEAWKRAQAWREECAEAAARKAEARKAKAAARASAEAAARARAAAQAKAKADAACAKAKLVSAVAASSPGAAEAAQAASATALAVAAVLLLLRLSRARAGGRSKRDRGEDSSAVLSDGAIDALIALLLAERRTPAEDARLEALLLLLSQASSPKGASSALPGGASDDPGAWRLVWTQKPLFWRGLAPLLQAQAEPALPGKQGSSPRGQQPGQSFCTAGATMTSSVAAGPLRLTARGTFSPAKGSGVFGGQPVFHADVGGGDLQLAFGPLGTLQLPLLLRGGGAWTLVYCSNRLRVFNSEDAGLAVQLPAAALPADAAA